uniref:Uncharacterized protein n=1 Tax=Globodera rostochiensis TaxID=31243 RepID=A0A914HH50_GLORO
MDGPGPSNHRNYSVPLRGRENGIAQIIIIVPCQWIVCPHHSHPKRPFLLPLAPMPKFLLICLPKRHTMNAIGGGRDCAYPVNWRRKRNGSAAPPRQGMNDRPAKGTAERVWAVGEGLLR